MDLREAIQLLDKVSSCMLKSGNYVTDSLWNDAWMSIKAAILPAQAGVVELLKQFAALPIDNYHASLNTPHTVMLIREARKILSVSRKPFHAE